MTIIITPPIRSIVEPPAPRHGPKHDTHEPYLRRRSSRIKSYRTPSPSQKHRDNNKQTNKHLSQIHSRNLSPPSSPISSNNPSPARQSRRDMDPAPMERNLLPKSTERMLPTPVKTPSKKETKRTIRPASRALFPQGLQNDLRDVIPRRNRVSLYSPGSTPSIEVYTDVNARVPEVDESEENVFYDAPHKKKRRSKAGSKNTECIEKKRKDSEQGGEDDERGMWFTFRGKHVWRKFEADDQDQYPEGTDMTGVPQPRGVTPPPRFTRTSYKPRTLFPEAHKKGDTTDEEAITDIEHPEKHGIDKSIAKLAGTPTKKRFYATPPTTARTTRSTAKRPVGGGDTTSEPDKLSTSLFTVIKGKRTSPFNEWARMKGEGGPTPGEKKKRKSDQTLTRKEAKRVKSDISD